MQVRNLRSGRVAYCWVAKCVCPLLRLITVHLCKACFDCKSWCQAGSKMRLWLQLNECTIVAIHMSGFYTEARCLAH